MSRLLFSTQTIIEKEINESFYGNKHYMWASTHLNMLDVNPLHPPSSNPLELFKGLAREVKRPDRIYTEIRKKRVGMTRGAMRQYADGNISATQRDEIINLVKKADRMHFEPLIAVVTLQDATPNLSLVPPTRAANPSGKEFLIQSIDGSLICFLNWSCIREN
jgi:hypothetical protein